jgi:hypothetical protein
MSQDKYRPIFREGRVGNHELRQFRAPGTAGEADQEQGPIPDPDQPGRKIFDDLPEVFGQERGLALMGSPEGTPDSLRGLADDQVAGSWLASRVRRRDALW